MKPRAFPHLFRGFLLLFLTGVMGGAVLVAQGPDRELHFLRETHSSTQLPILSAALQDLAQWPQWFHSLDKVTRLSASGAESPPSAPLNSRAVGEKIRFYFNDHKSPWSHMEMTAELLEISPQRLRLKVLTDSKEKITHLFKKLIWTVELEPESNPQSGAQGTLIRGIGLAETLHWKSRFFGTLTERILMNQVFYPNLIELAALRVLKAPGPPPVRRTLSSSDALLSIPATK